MCLLAARLIIHNTATRHVMLEMEKPAAEMPVSYFVIPAVMALVDVVETSIVLVFMLQKAVDKNHLLSYFRILSSGMLPLAIFCFLSHVAMDPLYSRIGRRFCE